MQPKAEVIAYSVFQKIPAELLEGVDLRAGVFTEQGLGSDGGRLTECAGRTCYDSYGKGRSSPDFHKHILEVAHGSVLEHFSISFYLSGISRGCSHELVRHRAGCAISQRSTRYVDESESEWAFHPLLSRDLEESGRLGEFRYKAGQLYRELVKAVQGQLEARGIDKLSARKQARGAARGVLGNALETSMVWTANLRALRNVLEQRASRHADAEIRLLANRLYEAALLVCPEYLSDYEKAACPDGIGYELLTQFRKL